MRSARSDLLLPVKEAPPHRSTTMRSLSARYVSSSRSPSVPKQLVEQPGQRIRPRNICIPRVRAGRRAPVRRGNFISRSIGPLAPREASYERERSSRDLVEAISTFAFRSTLRFRLDRLAERVPLNGTRKKRHVCGVIINGSLIVPPLLPRRDAVDLTRAPLISRVRRVHRANDNKSLIRSSGGFLSRLPPAASLLLARDPIRPQADVTNLFLSISPPPPLSLSLSLSLCLSVRRCAFRGVSPAIRKRNDSPLPGDTGRDYLPLSR